MSIFTSTTKDIKETIKEIKILVKKEDEFEKYKDKVISKAMKDHTIAADEFNITMPNEMLPILYKQLGELEDSK